MNTMTDPTLANPIDALLAPIDPAAPCGAPDGLDTVFTEIRLLREEDDPSLPMRQWERPLREADWPAVAALCVDVLAARSKHLQIAAWLVEAWMRQRGYAGLRDGLRLLDALLARYWDCVHPAIEADGDCDARVAPLEWLNGAVSRAVTVHAALLPLDGCKPPVLTVAQWDALTARELGPAPSQKGEETAPALTRADVLELARAQPDTVRRTYGAIAGCLTALDALADTLAERLGAAAPNLGQLEAALTAALRMLAQCLPEDEDDEEEARAAAAAPNAAEAPAPAGDAPARSVPPAPRWRSRAEAYATLAAVADYLLEVEPHSPVPFLIRRALHWGALPLPDLIAEIVREEGDLNRLVGVLGLKM